MGATKRGPASVPAEPTKLKLTLKVEGFQDDCNTCCGLADQLIEEAQAGQIQELSDSLTDIFFHVDDEHRP